MTVQLATEPTGLYQVGPHLLAYSENETAYVDGFGEQTIIVATGATGFSRSVGCVAFRSIVGVGENAVCWMSHRGIEYYTPGGEIQLVSRGLQTFFSEELNRDQISGTPGVPSAVYDKISQEYHCAVPALGTAQNSKTIIVNLLQRGRGWIGAPSLDEYAATTVGTAILFAVGGDGYLTEDAGGVELFIGTDGYLRFVGVGETALPTLLPSSGYYTSAISDGVASSLFFGPSARGGCVYSQGYDGFVRKHDDTDHDGVDLDDVLADGTGGIAVELDIVSRAFLFGQSRRRKRVRGMHVASINDASAQVTVSVLAGGVTHNEQTVTIPSTALNHPQRKLVRAYAVGDTPQIEVTSTDDVRIALLGASAELLREPIG